MAEPTPTLPSTSAGHPHRPALVLVGMSVREADAHDSLAVLAARTTTEGEYDASVAYLQLGDPSLRWELDRLADAGTTRIVLVGVCLGTLAPANSWLRRIASHWWRERPEAGRPVVEVTTAMARSDLDLDLVLDVTRPIHGAEAPLTSAAWEDVPRHRHQVLVCRGPRCTALASDKTAEALAIELMHLGQGDDDVLVTQTGCQFPCNHAPVVSVQPDDVWYGKAGPDAIRRIAREHLVAGVPVAEHRLSRTRTAHPDHHSPDPRASQENP
ncbi:(2Fe-2S) ferredoxin domain-containing protein [Nocardioides sp. AE5]|uniref:(2Fe-2S) ferredoxin domain-containing protein n=1 Tax=Nocardioides sp. AE5 TaxID=2962573 RepID=UPI002881BB23|nr:(2Fe-2S) ferredoxin domain-containing protein [Nocardioides sp. AE5]MDT0202182.1 (2Fe-2S) ferredoxin domain-containing protein [Nocardioides sp. AE5]